MFLWGGFPRQKNVCPFCFVFLTRSLHFYLFFSLSLSLSFLDSSSFPAHVYARKKREEGDGGKDGREIPKTNKKENDVKYGGHELLPLCVDVVAFNLSLLLHVCVQY